MIIFLRDRETKRERERMLFVTLFFSKIGTFSYAEVKPTPFNKGGRLNTPGATSIIKALQEPARNTNSS